MPAGRPPIYNEKVPKQAFKLCLLGATDMELADFFEVNIDTISQWKLDHVEFSEALKAGKDQADAAVVHSLYRRARGYSHKAVKIFLFEGKPVIADYIERFPPDTTACIFWLKNRQKKLWRNKEDDEPSPDGRDVTITGGLPPDANR
jgi:hypothetical protein